MPRSAAAILGLTLVAISIGFNTARYPVVWEMASPARAGQAAAATIQPEKPESTAPLPQQPSRPAEPIGAKPVSEVADKIAVGNAVSAEAKPATGGAAAVEPEAQKPLVPVMQISSAIAPPSEAAGAAGIRRLPPVKRADSIAIDRNTAPSFNGPIPVYPTTGIE